MKDKEYDTAVVSSSNSFLFFVQKVALLRKKPRSGVASGFYWRAEKGISL